MAAEPLTSADSLDIPEVEVQGKTCTPGFERFAEHVGEALDTGLLTVSDALSDGLYQVHVQTKHLINSQLGGSSSALSPLSEEQAPESCSQPVPDLHLRVQVRCAGFRAHDPSKSVFFKGIFHYVLLIIWKNSL